MSATLSERKKERPKSPRRMSPSQPRYCTQSGSREAELLHVARRAAPAVSSVHAVRAEDRDQRIARQDAHDEEDDDRDAEHRERAERQASGDVAEHQVRPIQASPGGRGTSGPAAVTLPPRAGSAAAPCDDVPASLTASGMRLGAASAAGQQGVFRSVMICEAAVRRDRFCPGTGLARAAAHRLTRTGRAAGSVRRPTGAAPSPPAGPARSAGRPAPAAHGSGWSAPRGSRPAARRRGGAAERSAAPTRRR